MKKNIYLGIFALVAIGIGIFFLIDVDRINTDVADIKIDDTQAISEEKPIGGERDEYGCLGPAGYSYSEEIMGCIRNWELDEDQKGAAALAVQKAGQTVGLTVIEVGGDVDGMRKVTLQLPNTEQFSIDVQYPPEIIDTDETEDTTTEEITAALIEKNGWEEGSVVASVNTNDGEFAYGTAAPPEGGMGGGGWYAAYIDGTWEIIWDGNGVIFCDLLEDFENTHSIEIPSTLIEECYDQTLEDTVTR